MIFDERQHLRKTYLHKAILLFYPIPPSTPPPFKKYIGKQTVWLLTGRQIDMQPDRHLERQDWQAGKQVDRQVCRHVGNCVAR